MESTQMGSIRLSGQHKLIMCEKYFILNISDIIIFKHMTINNDSGLETFASWYEYRFMYAE